jgi:hypothetical protein
MLLLYFMIIHTIILLYFMIIRMLTVLIKGIFNGEVFLHDFTDGKNKYMYSFQKAAFLHFLLWWFLCRLCLVWKESTNTFYIIVTVITRLSVTTRLSLFLVLKSEQNLCSKSKSNQCQPNISLFSVLIIRSLLKDLDQC